MGNHNLIAVGRKLAQRELLETLFDLVPSTDPKLVIRTRKYLLDSTCADFAILRNLGVCTSIRDACEYIELGARQPAGKGFPRSLDTFVDVAYRFDNVDVSLVDRESGYGSTDFASVRVV